MVVEEMASAGSTVVVYGASLVYGLVVVLCIVPGKLLWWCGLTWCRVYHA